MKKINFQNIILKNLNFLKNINKIHLKELKEEEKVFLLIKIMILQQLMINIVLLKILYTMLKN